TLTRSDLGSVVGGPRCRPGRLAPRSAAGVSGRDDVNDVLDVDRSDLDTELLGGLRHERAEGVPLSLRFPDVEYLQLVSAAEADMVQAPGGGALTGLGDHL